MARATDLLDLGIPSYYSWWCSMERNGSGIRVVVDDPEHAEGSGVTLTRELSAGDIHASFAALKDSSLCCGEAMAEDGYDYGCANDADLILQHAALGEVTYG